MHVYPCGNRDNPLTGVFATRSPGRPNPIGHFVTPLLGRQESTLRIGDIEAFDGTPVIDIKGYFSQSDSVPEARIPDWDYRRDPLV